MKYTFLYDKKLNQVACYSEGKIGYDKNIFNEIEITPTATEWEKLTQGYSIFIKDKKIFFKEKEPMPMDLQQEIELLKIEINTLKKLNN